MRQTKLNVFFSPHTHTGCGELARWPGLSEGGGGLSLPLHHHCKCELHNHETISNFPFFWVSRFHFFTFFISFFECAWFPPSSGSPKNILRRQQVLDRQDHPFRAPKEQLSSGKAGSLISPLLSVHKYPSSVWMFTGICVCLFVCCVGDRTWLC